MSKLLSQTQQDILQALEKRKKDLQEQDRCIDKLVAYHPYSMANAKLSVYMEKAEKYLNGVYMYARTGGDYRSYSLASLYGVYRNMIEVAECAMAKIREDLESNLFAHETFEQLIDDFYEKEECDE